MPVPYMKKMSSYDNFYIPCIFKPFLTVMERNDEVLNFPCIVISSIVWFIIYLDFDNEKNMEVTFVLLKTFACSIWGINF